MKELDTIVKSVVEDKNTARVRKEGRKEEGRAPGGGRRSKSEGESTTSERGGGRGGGGDRQQGRSPLPHV